MTTTNEYRARLEAERQTLEQELASVGRKNPANPADWEPVPQETGQVADPNDAADLIEGYEENAAILKDLEIRYNEVLAALDRIERGTYGLCEVGKERIAAERLEADPAARTCTKHLNA